MKSVRSLPPRLFPLSVLFSALVPALALALASPVRADFSDVPSDHWAYAYVSRAEQSGAVNGVGGGRFDPDSSVTEAQFYAMLLRTLTDEDIPQAALGEPWYFPYTTAAFFSGLSVGVNAQSPDTPLTRCQMAQVMANLAKAPRDAAASEKVLASVPDGDAVPEGYRIAVAFVYNAGLIRGMDESGSFRGDLPMTRAQAAAVWCRLADFLEESGVNDEIPSDPVPEEPKEPACDVLTVNGVAYRTGMPEEELYALAGEPDELLEAFGDYRWAVFGTGDYENRFFAAGISDGRAVVLCSAGKAFSYEWLGEFKSYGDTFGGFPHGSTPSVVTAEGDGTRASLRLDPNDGYILHAAFVAETQYATVRFWTEEFSVTEAECAGEARLLFHLVNAFRAAHGIRPMVWDEVAERAARNHAGDMAAGGYFSHDSADGRTMLDRMKEAGLVSWSVYGENIANGYWGAFDTHAGWVSSAAHRSNLLRDAYTRFGAGIGLPPGDSPYYVEDFYAQMGE